VVDPLVMPIGAMATAGQQVFALVRRLREELGVQIDTIDMGGGLASRNTLQGQYLPGDQATPSFAKYVERVEAGLDEVYGSDEWPRIVFESGRALVDDAGVMVSTVVGNKRLTDGRRAIVLDAGVNLLPTTHWYRHDVYPAQETHGTAEPAVFVGPLCMNIDVVRDRIQFPPLKAGDRVVVDRIGAYNVTQWMQFIALRPNVVMVSESGEHAIIRAAETIETLVQQERMPGWLA